MQFLIKINNTIFYLIVACLLFLIYQQNLNHEFLYDSYSLIESNMSLRNLFPLSKYFLDPDSYSTAAELQHYRPLVSLSYAINYQISGLEMYSWHLLQLVLHFLFCISCGVLTKQILNSNLFNLTSKQNKFIRYAVVLFLALHPLNAGVINYLSARSEMMMSLFLVLCKITFFSKLKTKSSLSLFALFYLLAIFSKISAVGLLFTIPILGIIKDFDSKQNILKLLLRSIKTNASYLLVIILVSLFYLGCHSVYNGTYINYQIYTESSLSPYLYFINQLTFVLRYILRVFIPIGLSTDYTGTVSYSSYFELGIILTSLCWLVFTSIFILKYKNSPYLLILLCCIISSLMITSSFIPINELWNERRQYLANFYIIFLAAVFIFQTEYRQQLKKILISFLLIALIVFPYLTYKRNPDFLTKESYWEVASIKSPSARSYLNLGNTLLVQGKLNESYSNLKIAEKLCSDCSLVWLNLSFVLRKMNPSNFPLSEELLSKIDNNSVRPSVLWEKAQIELIKNDFSAAQKLFLEIDLSYPNYNNYQVSMEIAKCSLFLKDFDNTRKYLKKSQEINASKFNQDLIAFTEEIKERFHDGTMTERLSLLLQEFF